MADRYRILALLGQGSMGRVYAAWHLGLDQRVAFKVLRRDRSGEDESVSRQRFQREARAAARIHSDHVCHVIDNGVLDDDTPYLVMEYLEGCDLASELRRRNRMPIHEAVRYVRQACAALAEAHRAGIVHRDLKPANLFLQRTLDPLDPSSEGRRIKVLDFGISKADPPAGTAQLSLTGTTTLLGSPVYMSPEQLSSSRDVDARSDVWALGVILYELITGTRPFRRPSITELVDAVLHREPPPCASHGVPVPRALEIIVARALRKDRQLRYQSMAELSLALAPYEREPMVNLALSETHPVPRASALSSPLGADEARTTNARESTTLLPGMRPAPLARARLVRRRMRHAVLITAVVIAVGIWLGRALRPAPRLPLVPRLMADERPPGATARTEPSTLPSSVELVDSASDDWLLPTALSEPPSPQTPIPAPPALRKRAPLPAARSAGGPSFLPVPRAAPAPSSPADDLGEFGGRR